MDDILSYVEDVFAMLASLDFVRGMNVRKTQAALAARTVLTGSFIGLLGGAPAFADDGTTADAPAAAESPGDTGVALEEVTVTANRRQESMQNVPLSVTAANAETLAANGITSTSDLSELTPGLVVNVANGWVEPFIRGVGTTANSTGLSSPVAIYVDGVYYAAPTGTLFSFNNIAAIEVDRGPQGTLFGRNATGGVIQVTTKDPSHTPLLDVQAGAANYRTGTGGVTDTLAGDIAVHYSKQDEGYGVNLYPGTGRDVYTNREADVRSKWLWTPTERDKITVALDYSNQSGPPARAVRFMNNSVPLGYPITP